MPISQKQLDEIKDTFDLVLKFKGTSKLPADSILHKNLTLIKEKLSDIPCYLNLEQRMGLVCYSLKKLIYGESHFICDTIFNYLEYHDMEYLSVIINDKSYTHLLINPHSKVPNDPYDNYICGVVKIASFLPELLNYMPNELQRDRSWFVNRYHRVRILDKILRRLIDAYVEQHKYDLFRF